jgi:hypothetical protein
MQFGYFTLSDNRYPDNPRSAEDFLKDIFRRGPVRRDGRAQLGLDRRAPFQPLGVNASPLRSWRSWPAPPPGCGSPPR